MIEKTTMIHLQRAEATARVAHAFLTYLDRLHRGPAVVKVAETLWRRRTPGFVNWLLWPKELPEGTPLYAPREARQPFCGACGGAGHFGSPAHGMRRCPLCSPAPKPT